MPPLPWAAHSEWRKHLVMLYLLDNAFLTSIYIFNYTTWDGPCNQLKFHRILQQSSYRARYLAQVQNFQTSSSASSMNYPTLIPWRFKISFFQIHLGHGGLDVWWDLCDSFNLFFHNYLILHLIEYIISSLTCIERKLFIYLRWHGCLQTLIFLIKTELDFWIMHLLVKTKLIVAVRKSTCKK